MNCCINGDIYELSARVRENPHIRRAFNELSREIFSLDFEPWYRAGGWGDDYIPYLLTKDGTAAANVSVNLMTITWQGRSRRYVQLGTVMTAPAFRGRGLSQWLIQRVLKDWSSRYDAMYLFANDSVLEFYPKFGFMAAEEYEYTVAAVPQPANLHKLDLSRPQEKHLLFEAYHKYSNPYAALSQSGNPGLLEFYCGQFLNGHVYYIEDIETLVLMEPEENGLVCYDIFGPGRLTMRDVLNAAAPFPCRVRLGFTPLSGGAADSLKRSAEDTLFLWKEGENLWKDHRLMFPLLSHA